MNIKELLLIVLLMTVLDSVSQSVRDIEKIEFCDSVFNAGIGDAFPGLAFAYYSSDTTWINTYGLSRREDSIQLSNRSLLQLGSVGKVLTAIAVLQMVEKGKLDLNEDIRNYLTWLELDHPVTLYHLLTHSAGMNDRNIGYFAKDSISLLPLQAHLKEILPTFYQLPGKDISYSNYSYALAGSMVELVSKKSFEEYVKNNILDVLGMKQTFVGFDFAYTKKPQFASGYITSADGFKSKQEFARHAIPAGSLISSANDMSLFISCMSRRDTILNQSSWEFLFGRQFSNHEQLTGYSLGLEEQLIGNQTFWAKGGMLQGFFNQIVFLPDSTAMFVAINTGDDSFLEEFHKAFLKRFYNSVDQETENSQNVDLSKYTGEYRNARYDRDGVENIISLFKGAFEIWEGTSGLHAYHNGEVHTYLYAGDHVFQNSSNPNEKLVFLADEKSCIYKLYRNVNIGGLYVPTTFEKTSWYNSPTFINEYYGFVPLTIILYSICLLFVIIVRIVRIWKKEFWKWKQLPGYYYFIAFIGIAAMVLHIIKAIMPLVKSPLDFLFGLPKEFVLYNNLSYAIVGLSVAMVILCTICFFRNKGSVLSRVLFSLITFCMAIHSWFLNLWNFI